jgi:hypothetical protein
MPASRRRATTRAAKVKQVPEWQPLTPLGPAFAQPAACGGSADRCALPFQVTLPPATATATWAAATVCPQQRRTEGLRPLLIERVHRLGGGRRLLHGGRRRRHLLALGCLQAQQSRCAQRGAGQAGSMPSGSLWGCWGRAESL